MVKGLALVMYLYAFATEKMTKYNLPNNDGFGGLYIMERVKIKVEFLSVLRTNI
ncbi:hypothetical protein [Chryseobacterium lactis]|uniref:hypothetical protein n=1 Tax=Chryseobacterium lactis TaxID=1241981 RepID=UPI00162581FC|nr:hypothetical protein [Chryseobacterium lactis]